MLGRSINKLNGRFSIIIMNFNYTVKRHIVLQVISSVKD